MKEIIFETIKFEQINIEEHKQLNFLLKSEKKVNDFIKRFENEDKIPGKEYELIYPRGSRPSILKDVRNSINQLLITALNSVLFCQR